MSICKLTAEQLKFAELLADPTDKRTQAEIAVELGVCEATLSRWKRTSGFSELVFALSIVEVKARLAKVMGGLCRAAEAGSVSAARLLFEATGIHQLQAAQRLFKEDMYVDYLEELGDLKASPTERFVNELRNRVPDPWHDELISFMEKASGELFDWADADDRIEVSDCAQVCLDDLYLSAGDQINVSAYYVVKRQ